MQYITFTRFSILMIPLMDKKANSLVWIYLSHHCKLGLKNFPCHALLIYYSRHCVCKDIHYKGLDTET